VKKYGADLRLKHLIYFTSGLQDYTTLPRASGMPWFTFDYFTIDEAIAATLGTQKLKFAPGTQWDYSNVNYMLLAKIVERVSGLSLSEFLSTRVFGPLGMRASRVDDDSTEVIPNRATGYVPRADESIRKELASVGVHVHEGDGYVRLPRISPHYGGSGVFSTVEDLAKWDESFYSHRLGGPAFTEQMLHREKFEHDKDNDAFGLVFGSFQDRQMIWFSGGDVDTSTFMARLPAEQLTVICLSNIPTGNAEAKAREVLAVLLAPDAMPAAVTPAPRP
jgi:CubicO group peptidase (beta-lactamase class C family)